MANSFLVHADLLTAAQSLHEKEHRLGQHHSDHNACDHIQDWVIYRELHDISLLKVILGNYITDLCIIQEDSWKKIFLLL